MALSFAHLDEPGGDQLAYYGCAKLAVLKSDGKWTQIDGPASLGNGPTVRQGPKNTVDALKMETMSMGASRRILAPAAPRAGKEKLDGGGLEQAVFKSLNPVLPFAASHWQDDAGPALCDSATLEGAGIHHRGRAGADARDWR